MVNDNEHPTEDADSIQAQTVEHHPPSGSYRRPTIAKTSLQNLIRLLGILSGSRQNDAGDAILVAIDFENTSNITDDLSRNLESQVGIATVDTRDIWTQRPDRLIKTFNYATGSQSYTQKASRRFLF